MKPAPIFKRVFLSAAVVMVLFTIIGFFVLPPIVRSQLEKRLSAELGRNVTLGKTKLNPYTLSVTLENLSISERDQSKQFIGWRQLHVNFDALASLGGEWVLKEIALDGLEGRFELNADGSLNVSDILARLSSASDPAGTPTESRPVRIEHLRLSNARVDFTDHSRGKPFVSTVGPMTFALTQFRTASGRGAPYHFDARTESGEKLAWSGTLQAQPLRSSGKLSIEDIPLVKYAPYYSGMLNGDLTAGMLSIQGRYEAEFAAGNDPAVKFLEGGVRLRGLSLRERGNRQPALDLASIDIMGVEADTAANRIAADAFVLTGAHVRVRRETDGEINLMALLGSGIASEPVAPSTAPERAVNLSIKEVSIRETRIDILDNAAPQPARIGLGNIHASVRDVSLAEGAQMPLQLTAVWAPRGNIKVAGNISLKPLRAELETALDALDLLPLSPYVEQFAAARLAGGTITSRVNVDISSTDTGLLGGTATGDIRIEDLAVVDAAQNEDLTGFDALALTGLKLTTGEQFGVSLDELALTAPYARVVVNRDGSLNLGIARRTGEVAPEQGQQVEPPAAGTNAASAASIDIARVVITDGDYRFTDRSVTPTVNVSLNRFGGTITGLSSTTEKQADVDLKALIDGAGPVSIAGRFDPLRSKKAMDLKVDFKNVDLVPLSPYSGKYAGYELIRGKLLLDVKVALDGNRINAANVMTLHQFTFGDAVTSPEATTLPVRLGVALLKDRQGNIVIDLPVEGNIDDPEFRIGKVVTRVIVNLLTKAATSPFALLGAAFGANGDELSYQNFAPGSADLQPGEAKKIQSMIQALTNRPALTVALEGTYDAAADSKILKQAKLTEQVRRSIWAARRAADPNLAAPHQLEITAEEHARMMQELYDRKFPPGTEFGIPLPPPPAAIKPVQVSTAFFRRAFDSITGQSRREQRLAERENERLMAEHAAAVEAAIARGLPLEQITERLVEGTDIDDNDLAELRQTRARNVRDALIAGGISPERLFLAKDQTKAATTARQGTRVFLTLQ